MTWWRWAPDLRYAVRTLARRPGLSLVAAGSLALVIGTATAQLSYLDFLLWAKLPVPHPEGLVGINVRTPHPGWAETSYPDYLDYRDGAAVLSGLAASGPFGTTVQIGADTTHVWGHLVSGNFFSVLGAGMARGRPLGIEDDRPGAERVAVLSHGFWRRACHGDPAILGRGLLLNGVSFTVVGIAPEGFRGSGIPAELYVPLAQQAYVRVSRHQLLLQDRDFGWLSLVGRLRPGVELGQARAALSSLAVRLSREDSGRQVLRRALALAGAGALLGLAAAVAGERLLASFLPGVPATPEPLTLAAAAALLLAVTLLAALQPARRAARVDPVRAISGPLH